jgi:hypothetical protein
MCHIYFVLVRKFFKAATSYPASNMFYVYKYFTTSGLGFGLSFLRSAKALPELNLSSFGSTNQPRRQSLL